MGTFSYRRQSDLRARRFHQLSRSAIWQQLRRIGSGQIDQLAAAVAAMVQQHPMKVSNLDSVLKNLASFKFPTSNPASPPAPKPAAVQGARSAGGPPGRRKKSAYC